MTRFVYILGLALAVAPLSAAVAQDAEPRAGGRRGGPMGPMGDPVSALLGRAETLGLSAGQVAQLEAIRDDLEALNAPLEAQLAELRPDQGARGPRGGGTPPDSTERAAMRELRAELQPVMEEIRQNNADAREEALGVLTDAQREQAGQLLRDGRQGPGGRGVRPGGPGGQGGPGPRVDRAPA